MNRPIALCTAFLGTAAASFCGCAGERYARPINHVVLVTLNDPSQREQLRLDTVAMLDRVGGVCDYDVGTPVDIGRPQVDGTYDVGFMALFKSREAYEAYEHDPAHLKLIETWKPRVKQLRIYDFQSP